MLDSGASYHILNRGSVVDPQARIFTSDHGKIVDTANGKLELIEQVHTPIFALQETVTAYVCQNSSNVLSLGQLCKIHGCKFVWNPWESKPQVYDARGAEIDLWCEYYVPYFNPASVAQVLASSAVPEPEVFHPDAASSGGVLDTAKGEAPKAESEDGVPDTPKHELGGVPDTAGTELGGVIDTAMPEKEVPVAEDPKESATMRRHLMTHVPKREDCEACQAAKACTLAWA